MNAAAKMVLKIMGCCEDFDGFLVCFGGGELSNMALKIESKFKK